MNKKATKEALMWIVELLERNKVPYQIVGGLAAITYGVKRELADIDIFIPNFGFEKIADEVKEYTQFGPKYHIGTQWKLTYQALNYLGQEIELCDSDNTEYLNSQTQMWVKQQIDFSNFTEAFYLGVKIKVMQKNDLINYKKELNRDVDALDVEEMKNTLT